MFGSFSERRLNRIDGRKRLKCKLYSLHCVVHTVVTFLQSTPMIHTKRAKQQSRKYQIANNPNIIWNACNAFYLIINTLDIFEFIGRTSSKITSPRLTSNSEADGKFPRFFILCLDHFLCMSTPSQSEETRQFELLQNFFLSFVEGRKISAYFCLKRYLLVAELDSSL